jgi:hypothetical protein
LICLPPASSTITSCFIVSSSSLFTQSNKLWGRALRYRKPFDLARADASKGHKNKMQLAGQLLEAEWQAALLRGSDVIP